METLKYYFTRHQNKLPFIIVGAVALVLTLGVLVSVIIFSRKNKDVYAEADEKMARNIEMANTVVKTEYSHDVSDAGDGNDLEEYSTFWPMELEESIDEPVYFCDRIDFDALSDMCIAEDVECWITIPDTNVDYVVMKGSDADPLKYLWKDPEGKDSSTGSLFVVPTSTDDIDAHKIIYGHRLKDHSIYFGCLLEYRDPRYAAEHRTCFLYYKDRVVKYRLRSVTEGLESDPVYYFPYVSGSEDYFDMVSKAAKNGLYSSNEVFDANTNTLVLSTCSGRTSGKPDRLYLIYEEIDELYY